MFASIALHENVSRQQELCVTAGSESDRSRLRLWYNDLVPRLFKACKDRPAESPAEHAAFAGVCCFLLKVTLANHLVPPPTHTQPAVLTAVDSGRCRPHKFLKYVVYS